jgi:hypothetical protein
LTCTGIAGEPNLVERVTGKTLNTFGTVDEKFSPTETEAIKRHRERREEKVAASLPLLMKKSRFRQIAYLFKGEAQPEVYLKPVDQHILGRFLRYGAPLSPGGARSLIARMLSDKAMTESTLYLLEDFFMPDLTSTCFIFNEDGEIFSLLEYELADWDNPRVEPERRKAHEVRKKR